MKSGLLYLSWSASSSSFRSVFVMACGAFGARHRFAGCRNPVRSRELRPRAGSVQQSDEFAAFHRTVFEQAGAKPRDNRRRKRSSRRRGSGDEIGLHIAGIFASDTTGAGAGNTVGIARTDRDDLPDIGRKGDIAPRLVALVAGALHENRVRARREQAVEVARERRGAARRASRAYSR